MKYHCLCSKFENRRYQVWAKKTSWHKWWAWRPVRIGETDICVWLTWVERRYTDVSEWDQTRFEWRYIEV